MRVGCPSEYPSLHRDITTGGCWRFAKKLAKYSRKKAAGDQSCKSPSTLLIIFRSPFAFALNDHIWGFYSSYVVMRTTSSPMAHREVGLGRPFLRKDGIQGLYSTKAMAQSTHMLPSCRHTSYLPCTYTVLLRTAMRLTALILDVGHFPESSCDAISEREREKRILGEGGGYHITRGTCRLSQEAARSQVLHSTGNDV